MSKDLFRLATIGTGNIARFHRRAMSDLRARGLDSFVVTAVCDANEASAQAAAQDCEERFGRRPAVYTDHRELLRCEQLDGADLCLPVGLHHSVAIDCLEAGVHVLSEKPLGITIKATRQMIAAAQRTGRVLATAHQIRRQPAPRAVRWMWQQGLIGEPATFFHQIAQTFPRGGRPPSPIPYTTSRLMDGGASLLICGVHYFDSMRYLFGDIDTIYAKVRQIGPEGAQPPDQARENAVHAVITFKSGMTGTWAYWLAAPGEETTDVLFYGTRGTLRDTSATPYRCWCHLLTMHEDIPDTGYLTQTDGTRITLDELKQMHQSSIGEAEREALFPHGCINPMGVELWDFMETVRGQRSRVEVDGEDGLQTVACAHATYESALTGDVVKVDDILSGKCGAFQAPLDAHWGL